jgi:hypothetical protein
MHVADDKYQRRKNKKERVWLHDTKELALGSGACKQEILQERRQSEF